MTLLIIHWIGGKNVLVLVSKTAIHKENKCRDQKSYLCPESYAIEQKSEVQKWNLLAKFPEWVGSTI